MMIFLIIHWREDGLRRSEAFGPWAVSPDGMHLSEIAEFGRLWVARFPDRSIVASELYLPTDPRKVTNARAV